MYLPKNTPQNRIREAQKARENRLEIVRALASGQVTRRELFNRGLFTASGLLAWKHGLNVYAPSAYGQVPTGTPRSPLFGARKFSQPLHRLEVPRSLPLTRNAVGDAVFPAAAAEPNAKRLSYHNDFNAWKLANPGQPSSANPFCNSVTKRGPMEGRPHGEAFAHQRWDEFFPRVGYVLSLAELESGHGLHPVMPFQQPNSIWTYWHRSRCARAGAALTDQGPLRRAAARARLQCAQGSRIARVSGPGFEPRLWPLRNPAALPQCPQRRRKRWRRQRASLPRYLL